MLDSEDLTLFFEKPVVHLVQPLQQEGNPCQLKAPPPLTDFPDTQDAQKEAESLSLLSSFSHEQTVLQPLSKGSDGSNTYSSKVNSLSFFSDQIGNEEQHGLSNPGGYDRFWKSSSFSHSFLEECHSGKGADETLQEFDQGAMSKYPPFDCVPSLRKSLFKRPEMTTRSDSSTKNDPETSSSQTASTPEVYRNQPPLGFSAPSGRLPQAAQRAETQSARRAVVPPMTPQPLHIQGSAGVLRPVSEIPVKFRSVFSEFPFFNYVQSQALDDVLYTNKNFVACAPTGSGKTVLFELAIIRLLMETQEPWRDVKAVYMAPIKALCSQCFDNWNKKFGHLGLICKELTGDTEIEDFFEIQDSNIILTTPEKWDSLTRKWRDNCLLQLVRLFLIDEVHVVKDATRGATLEVVVSRMKAVHSFRTSQNPEAGLSMRFVAVSATIPNVSDIAEWLSNEGEPAAYLNMNESHRPVKLRKVVLGFPCNPNQTEFKFDLSLSYKMANIIQTYSDQKPALVFCSTRKGAQQSAATLAKDARFNLSIEHKQRLMTYANSMLDSKLRDLVLLGIGFHHAGLGLSDRKLVEEAFTHGVLSVLFTTRTLAMGVNLPAHLVVIKSTMQYVAGSCEEYSEADILQMIGRAGRPQFDTSATAVIMTKVQTRDKYMKLMNGMEVIESSLHGHLVEHLNAEIVLQTISDVNMALDWIRSTFLYIRALKNPAHYGFTADFDKHGIEAQLQELCLKNLNSLSSIDLISMDEDINIKPTEAGRLMARYCVAFDTMKQFSKVDGSESLSDLVELVSKSKELSEIQLRVNEKRSLNSFNKDKNRTTIRFPLNGKIKSSEMKVNCLIQAQLGCISIQDFGLSQDTAKIFRIGLRISKCLSEFLSQRSKTGFSALLNSIILAKCFQSKLWENSPYVSKQLEKIGQTLSTAMVNAGLTTFTKIEQINPRELELIVNRHPPFGNQIRESVLHLPKYEVCVEQLPRYNSSSAEIFVKVILTNQTQLQSKRTSPDRHYVSLLIGNADNSVVCLHKLTDLILLKCGTWSKKIEVTRTSKGDELSVNLISSQYVGLDVQQRLMVHYTTLKGFGVQGHSDSCTIADAHPGPKQQLSASASGSAVQVGNQNQGKKQPCSHSCKNKSACGHDCCKVCVTAARRRPADRESSFSSYLSDLKSRSDALAQTPVKRLKMKLEEQPLLVSMQKFAFKPKPAPRPLSCHDGSWIKASDTQQTAESDEGFGFHEDERRWKAETASRLSHSSWMIPGTNSRCLSSGPNRISTSHSQNQNDVFLQIPAVTFDLGNEWDDFDDEKLLRASEDPRAEAQWLQTELRVSGGAAASATPFPSRSAAPAAPQSFSQAAVNPGIRKLGSSHLSQRFPDHRRITLDVNTKKPSVFSRQYPVKPPERPAAPRPGVHLPPGMHFFHAEGSSSLSRSSREEEAFVGIFDGIF
ncbi:probable ATP-dependent DNA helicase HFM1 isoform X2 [Oryzias melastigma]|uniref:probable ATP-dependent DNA helicase HFM1 isoform X2 n=1 Tax=Oryzias melastigma TaxID=30732 RepID=UPI000CF8032D|nr:probable ATP-dependent DNA helicase HFM1 isoform X2 [Oryzias melastigma]